MQKGLIHIYCGDGKGKTTCSIGLLIRALGGGYSVIFTQFLKGSKTSELNILKELKGVKILRVDKKTKFSWEMNGEEKDDLKGDHNELFKRAIAECGAEKTLLILDEMVGTYAIDLIDREMVLAFLRSKPDNVEVVLTGRNPTQELLELADYVSEIKKIKHPMDKGIMARGGIEI